MKEINPIVQAILNRGFDHYYDVYEPNPEHEKASAKLIAKLEYAERLTVAGLEELEVLKNGAVVNRKNYYRNINIAEVEAGTLTREQRIAYSKHIEREADALLDNIQEFKMRADGLGYSAPDALPADLVSSLILAVDGLQSYLRKLRQIDDDEWE